MPPYKLPVITGTALSIGDLLRWDGSNWVNHPDSNYQAQGDVLDDLNTLGAVGANSEFLVGTGAGALAWESDTTVRTSLGLGTGDSVEFGNLTVSNLTLKGGIIANDVSVSVPLYLLNSAPNEDIIFRYKQGVDFKNIYIDASEDSFELGTANLTTTGDIDCDRLTINGGGTQNYLFTNRESSYPLALQSQASNTAFEFGLYTKDANKEDTIFLHLWAGTTPTSGSGTSSYERFEFTYLGNATPANRYCRILSHAGATGTIREIRIYAGTGNANQIVCKTDGNVQIGADALDFTFAMGTPVKDDPTTDAPDNFVEVEIGGVTHYLPAYI